MMHTGKKAIVAAVALNVTAGFTLPVQAGADVDLSKSYQVGVTTGSSEGFQNVDVNKGRVSWLMYNSLSSGLMPTAFYLDAYADGQKVEFAGENTKVQPASNSEGDVVTLTHTDPKLGVELVRTFTVTSKEVDVRVELKSDSKRDLKLVLTDGLMSYDYPITSEPVESRPNEYTIDVGGRYQLHTKFEGADSTGTGKSQQSAEAGANDGDSYFAGVWERHDDSLSARMTIAGDANEALKDSDGDGLPDEWEINGYTDADGNQFPLHRWGADPNKPDLFLQLNWMKSEWETKGCSEKRQYAATEDDFGEFLECADANVNVYRPSRQISTTWWTCLTAAATTSTSTPATTTATFRASRPRAATRCRTHRSTSKTTRAARRSPVCAWSRTARTCSVRASPSSAWASSATSRRWATCPPATV